MMDSINRKRNLISTKGLGRLRTRVGISFSWIDSPTETNHVIGRVYYPGFTLCNDACIDSFMVGDIIRMKTRLLNETIYQIVSAFQATVSFSGLWHGQRQEVQKRGEFFN